jgi:hypothetical protein
VSDTKITDLLQDIESNYFIDRCPDSITVEDVWTVILTRPEFDLFSNRGLGVQVTDTG